MRMRTRTLLMIGVLAFVATAVLWRLGDARFSVRRGPWTSRTDTSSPLQTTFSNLVVARVPVLPASLAATAAPTAAAPVATTDDRKSLRLTNTDRPVDALSRDEQALVLRNAFIDTSTGRSLEIPENLRAGDEPGSYVVQARGAVSREFQDALRNAGTRFVSYVPVNAYLVAATAAQAARLQELAVVGAVVPFEPYFKLEPALLGRAVRDEILAPDQRLTITLLPGAAREVLNTAGAEVQAEFATPFGPGFLVDAKGMTLAGLARIPEVQGIEMFRQRQLLNDRVRDRFGISLGTNAPGVYTNYLGLTGTNVVVNINDSGIDESHPDLLRRVTGDAASTLVDLDGHGTHVAGTIAGSGVMSGSVSNAPGSAIPGADFRGMAPEAKLFALPVDLNTGPLISDAYLQRTAATNYYVTQGRTNLLISNNSWGYINAFEYTVASASYDAAVRDALPEMTGAQPILYVFASGNEGSGADDGQGGEANTVRAPGTGKNVITVGAIESLREITNEVVSILPDGTFTTNQVFLGETDTDDQITSFSGRGNIEPGIEGPFGRFKPDVVAPGSFTISARSSDWVDPEFFTRVLVNRIERQNVTPENRMNYSLFVPERASEFRVRLLRNDFSPDPLPWLPMYLRYGDIADVGDLVGTNNIIRVPPDGTLRAGDWFYSVGNNEDRAVSYDIQTLIVITNGNAGYFDQLKQLNSGLGPNYRFESGTSMAAPAVSGLLALYQDYFQREKRVVSPALLKALLINGARSLGSHYNFSLRDVLNLQGWGGANITNALPAGEFGSLTGSVHAVQFTDQTGTNSLSTGQERTWRVTVAPEGADQILKFSLVWTDPPGNPASGIKLVNDLDLIVKNEESGEEYHGNDIPFRSDFNVPHAAGATVTNDNVNNVENVLLRPPIGTNYLLTVRGRRVNVNAVPVHPDGIAQDFALVASVANTRLTNVLDIQLTEPFLAATPVISRLTNGLPIVRARTGAMPPRFGTLPGSSNQWSFFVFTNLQSNTPQGVGLTNGQFVAFLTFGAMNLARPREAGADIDLYATTDPGITNLNPVAVQNSLKSVKPGGTETIVLTNAPLGAVYYLAVKAEDQQGAEFTIAGLSSNQPFDQDDGQGNRIVRGVPNFVPIPDGSPDEPQVGYVFGIVTTSFPVRQVTVTNTVSFDSTGDLLFNLAHETSFAVLGNHELDPFGRGGVETTVYDDSGAGVGIGQVFGKPSDGPGTLQSFVGMEAVGAWILTVTDNALTQVATNVALSLFVQREPAEDQALFFTLSPGEWVRRARRLPPSATNLIVRVTDISGGSSDLEIYARRLFPPSLVDYDKFAIIPSGRTEGFLTLGLSDVPPLNPGLYHAAVYNPGPETMSGALRIDYEVDPNLAGDRGYGTMATFPIPDDAVIRSSIHVLEDRVIGDVRVGVRVDHPRVSDLVFRLISPQGTRLVLSENRGGEIGKAYGAENGSTRIFTSFTDDTNRTVIPIKFGEPAFTNNPVLSTASNRVVMADGFEVPIARTYLTGEAVAPGWRIVTGQGTVVRTAPGSTNRFEGDQYLVLDGGGVSSIVTNIALTPGTSYRVQFGVNRLPGGQPQGLQIYLDNQLVNDVVDNTAGTGWTVKSFVFTATSQQGLLEFRSMSNAVAQVPLALDGVLVEEADAPMHSYYLAEEKLRPLIGQRSLGEWRLEITDGRAGPVATNSGVLLGWRLELDFDLDTIAAIQLTNGVPYFGSVNEDEVQYFYVDTPVCATTSVNILAGELATLLLYGNRDGLPEADLDNFVDDYGPYINVEAGGRATLTLTTNTPASAPLRPGQRYFLAVRNFQPDRFLNPFGIMVVFDCVDSPLPVVPSLTNGIPFTATIDPGPGLHYYQFEVSSNAIRADFELTPLSGNNVDMYIKRGRLTPPEPADPRPLPNPNVFDYRSDLPSGTNIDTVSIGRTSFPEPLVPGIWFVAVRNGDVVPAQYSIKVTETYTTIINLTNGVAFTNTIAPLIDPLVGFQGEDLQFYAFQVSSNSVQASFETFGADGNVDLYVRRGLPIPTPYDFHFASEFAGSLSEYIAVTNTTAPIWLAPGWWFLAVANQDSTNVTYSVRATEIAGLITPLVNDVAVTNTVGPNPAQDYYSFNVSPTALSSKFEVFGMSEDVHLLLRQGLPLPTYFDYTYLSANAGLTNELIELTPFSFPVGLTPGDWYLTVANPGTNNATYTVRASQETATVITLTNGVPYNAGIQPGGVLDYYQFEVETNAVAAEFKLTSAGAGNLDLFLRKGPPLPDAANAHYTAATPGVVDELIRLEPNSTPVPLSPGIWYLSVTNNEAVPVGYEITATQFGIEPPPLSGNITNIVITDTNICVTWVSIPSTNYYVVAKTNALDAVWTPISPTITAVDTSTTWCIEPPGNWRFFDVFEGDSPAQPIPAPVPVLRLDGTTLCVGFASVPGTNYYIQAKKVSTDPDWFTLTPQITATDAFTEVCYPLEWGYRFFKVGVGSLVLPEPIQVRPELVTVELTLDSLCITWPTQAGLDYLVEAKRDATDPNWAVISEAIRGDGTPGRLCLDPATEFRFFRVMEGVSVLPGAPPNLPVPNYRLTADAAFQLCLVWDTLLGAEYFVEAKQRFTDPSWSVVSPILNATGVELSYCVPLSSTWRYYQIRRVNRPPNVPPHIADIEVVATGIQLQWTGLANARYQVFYSDSVPTVWRPAGDPVTSVTTEFRYLDNGTQTGGFSGFRVYRIEMLP